MTDFVCGLDAGGTASRAIVASPSESRFGWGRAAGANPTHRGFDGGGANMLAAVEVACAAAGVHLSELGAIFCGVASIISEADRAGMTAQCQSWGLASNCVLGLDHDIRIALQGGLSGRPGIALIAGTGSSCYGRNAGGESWQSGGWDQILDDAGSGFDIARRGMAAACQSADGRLAPTSLQEMFFDRLGVSNVADFSVKVHRPLMERHSIAALAPIVLAAAEAGDQAASRIISTGAAELAQMVEAVTARLFPAGDPEIVFIGGLLEQSVSYQAEVKRAIRERTPLARFCETAFRPAVGAWMLAAELAGLPFDAAFLSQLSESTRS